MIGFLHGKLAGRFADGCFLACSNRRPGMVSDTAGHDSGEQPAPSLVDAATTQAHLPRRAVIGGHGAGADPATGMLSSDSASAR